MSKAILKKNLMEKVEVTEKQAEEIIECFIETINKETLENKKFQITGWGTFKLKETERHEKFIPFSNETVKVPAKKVLKFTASKSHRF